MQVVEGEKITLTGHFCARSCKNEQDVIKLQGFLELQRKTTIFCSGKILFLFGICYLPTSISEDESLIAIRW